MFCFCLFASLFFTFFVSLSTPMNKQYEAEIIFINIYKYDDLLSRPERGGGGGHLGIFWVGMCVPPVTPNCHPVLKKNSPKIDTPF